MPRLSLREIRAELRRERSTERLVSAELIVESSRGGELCRAGGVWDGWNYIAPPPGFDHQPEVFRLNEEQDRPMDGFAAWLRAMDADLPDRDRVFMLGGQPGSGKTLLLMVWQLLVALKWPRDFQWTSVLNLDNRTECLVALGIIGRPNWWTEVDDPKNPHLRFFNGAQLRWTSARNVRRLRQRGLPLRFIGINEAQDQSDELYAVAQTAPRLYGAAVGIATNPPTQTAGNWTSKLWLGLEAGEGRGKVYLMKAAGNAAIDQDFIRDSGQLVRIAAPRLVGAHVDGDMRQAGLAAYPTFDARAYNPLDPLAGGCVGELLWKPDIGPAPKNVTRELTAPFMGSARGADVVIGCDFQGHPGCVAAPMTFWRLADGTLVAYVERIISVPGQEDALSQALYAAGYTGNGWRRDGTQGPIALLVGDGTGDRQSADHSDRPSSFWAMQNNGWTIIAPDVHHRTGNPWWAPVLESLDQMHALFERRQVVLGPECRKPSEAMPSLVECLRNVLKNEWTGKLRKGDKFGHPPDAVRYPIWRLMPRHKADEAPPLDEQVKSDIRSIRLSDR